jgi:hypothetical protein
LAVFIIVGHNLLAARFLDDMCMALEEPGSVML